MKIRTKQDHSYASLIIRYHYTLCIAINYLGHSNSYIDVVWDIPTTLQLKYNWLKTPNCE